VPDPGDTHFKLVTRGILDGRVVPFLGAGVNLCGRPVDTVWKRGEYYPSGAELAAHLAKHFDYPPDEDHDLERISQYVAIMTGSGPLYETLHEIFDADYPPTELHRFLASIPAIRRELDLPVRHQLIVTTNYDDAMERALEASGEEYDLVSYSADGEFRGKFLHWAQGAEEAQPIERPNEYTEISLEERSVILKIHGLVDRKTLGSDFDSYVITMDHYLDYLARYELSNLIPVTLAAKLKKSHFLFLGYALRDFNLNVILRRLWGEQKLSYKSWAIQLDPSPLDLEIARHRGVDIVDTRLEEYVTALEERVRQPVEEPA
jgi:SIR2-like protein